MPEDRLTSMLDHMRQIALEISQIAHRPDDAVLDEEFSYFKKPREHHAKVRSTHKKKASIQSLSRTRNRGYDSAHSYNGTSQKIAVPSVSSVRSHRRQASETSATSSRKPAPVKAASLTPTKAAEMVERLLMQGRKKKENIERL